MNNAEIGKRIKEYRRAKKLTQKQLATAIGKTESSIRKYEKGLVEIPISTIEDIAIALEVPVKKIYRVDENENINFTTDFSIIDSLIESCNFIARVEYTFNENNNPISMSIDDTSGNRTEFSIDELINIQCMLKSFFKTVVEDKMLS